LKLDSKREKSRQCWQLGFHKDFVVQILETKKKEVLFTWFFGRLELMLLDSFFICFATNEFDEEGCGPKTGTNPWLTAASTRAPDLIKDGKLGWPWIAKYPDIVGKAD
jgi:hypothetical protein